MLVRMRIQISGTRNGVDWPAPGDTIDVTETEAMDLVGAELADIVEAPKPKASK